MSDHERGLYGKYIVTRMDGGSNTGMRHANCYYFVLDTEHDPHARAALVAYANSCRAEYPLLAHDIDKLVDEKPFGGSTPTAE